MSSGMDSSSHSLGVGPPSLPAKTASAGGDGGMGSLNGARARFDATSATAASRFPPGGGSSILNQPRGDFAAGTASASSDLSGLRFAPDGANGGVGGGGGAVMNAPRTSMPAAAPSAAATATANNLLRASSAPAGAASVLPALPSDNMSANLNSASLPLSSKTNGMQQLPRQPSQTGLMRQMSVPVTSSTSTAAAAASSSSWGNSVDELQRKILENIKMQQLLLMGMRRSSGLDAVDGGGGGGAGISATGPMTNNNPSATALNIGASSMSNSMSIVADRCGGGMMMPGMLPNGSSSLPNINFSNSSTGSDSNNPTNPVLVGANGGAGLALGGPGQSRATNLQSQQALLLRQQIQQRQQALLQAGVRSNSASTNGGTGMGDVSFKRSASLQQQAFQMQQRANQSNKSSSSLTAQQELLQQQKHEMQRQQQKIQQQRMMQQQQYFQQKSSVESASLLPTRVGGSIGAQTFHEQQQILQQQPLSSMRQSSSTSASNSKGLKGSLGGDIDDEDIFVDGEFDW